MPIMPEHEEQSMPDGLPLEPQIELSRADTIVRGD
jgi:hypothetical protein